MRGRLAAIALAAAALVAGGVALEARRRRWTRVLTMRIPAHHDHWRERKAGPKGSLLYVALGDSAALGLGASEPRRGYVGLLAEEVGRLTGAAVRVRNLAIDGATLRVVIEDELPRLAGLRPVVCTLDAGSNDIWTFEPDRFRAELDEVCAALPPGSIVAELPSFSVIPIGGRVARANRIVREVAAAHGHLVAPLNATTAVGGPIDAIRGSAGDLFHPNDRGHRRWAEAFLPAVRTVLRRREAGASRP